MSDLSREFREELDAINDAIDEIVEERYPKRVADFSKPQLSPGPASGFVGDSVWAVEPMDTRIAPVLPERERKISRKPLTQEELRRDYMDEVDLRILRAHLGMDEAMETRCRLRPASVKRAVGFDRAARELEIVAFERWLASNAFEVRHLPHVRKDLLGVTPQAFLGR